MEITDIVQLVASTGFSIVVAIWSLWFTFNNISKNQTDTTARIAELAAAVNDNTTSIKELIIIIKNKEEN